MSQRTALVSTSDHSATPRMDATPPSEEAIAHRAFAKFQARGGAHGFDEQDWADAEKELHAEGSGADR